MKNGRKLNKIQMLMLTVVMLLVFICGGIYLSATAYTERSAVISSDGSNVYVRNGPGTTYGGVATLTDGTKVTIIGEDMASDGAKWYEVRFTVNESTKTGFIHSTYLIYTDYSGIDEEELPSFQELLEGFPESYREPLLKLYDMYPSWKFVPVYTELDWADVLEAESSRDRSLVTVNAISSWKSLEEGAYDWNTSTWYGKDGAKWVTASEDIVAHYLDPRNYLNGSMIFAFIAHAYDAEAQTIEGVQSIMKGTFMETDFVDTDGVARSYAEVLMEAGRQYGVSPYVLAASIRIEIGMAGTSASISGTEVGYEGLFNYYNVSAYADGGLTANQKGLWWAGGAGVGATTYGRPWNTRYKSLMGGAEYYATNYVKRGQNTLYLKKFNVTSTNTYNHQYMTNIQGAASEAHAYARAYNAEAKMQNLVFYIPVYENMPETACPKPTGTGSPNNKLDAITIDGVPIENFDMDTYSYVVEVDALAATVNLGAVPKDSTAVITGTGDVEVAFGETVYNLICTAQNGDQRIYTVTLVQTEDAELGELTVSGGTLTPEFDGDIYEYKVLITEEFAEILVSASARNEEAVVEIIGDGEGLTTGSVITIQVTAKDGVTIKEYQLAVEYQEPETTPDESTDPDEGTSPDESTDSDEGTTPDESTDPDEGTTPDESTDPDESTEPDTTPEENVTVDSAYYIIEDNYISGIYKHPTTKELLLDRLTITGGTAEVYAADGETVLESAANVGTGALVKIYDENGELYDTYTVLIYGDVNGDGKLSAMDLMLIRQFLKQKIEISGIYYKVADVSRNGEVAAMDLMLLRQHLKGRLVLEQ